MRSGLVRISAEVEGEEGGGGLLFSGGLRWSSLELGFCSGVLALGLLVLGFEAGKRRRTNGVLGVRISPEKRVKGAGVFGVWWSAFGRV